MDPYMVRTELGAALVPTKDMGDYFPEVLPASCTRSFAKLTSDGAAADAAAALSMHPGSGGSCDGGRGRRVSLKRPRERRRRQVKIHGSSRT